MNSKTVSWDRDANVVGSIGYGEGIRWMSQYV